MPPNNRPTLRPYPCCCFAAAPVRRFTASRSARSLFTLFTARRAPRMLATPRPMPERRSMHGREHEDVTIGRSVTSFDACMAERAQGMAHHDAVCPRGGWLLACQHQDLGMSTRPIRRLCGPSRCNAAPAPPGCRNCGQALAAAAASAGATGNECRWVHLEPARVWALPDALLDAKLRRRVCGRPRDSRVVHLRQLRLRGRLPLAPRNQRRPVPNNATDARGAATFEPRHVGL